MDKNDKTLITVETVINAPIETVWNKWTNPDDIVKWNNASDDWHTTRAENDLKVGGKFVSRMEAKDGSMGFDFGGTYDTIKRNQLIEYTADDNRKVKISFSDADNKTKIIEIFEAENENPIAMQQSGWQSILNNFKEYTESKL
ncbi:SRPBCC family protein [Flavobacterium sp. ZT3R17]|uniref:SRPBCC family protein n=1 Tax=Flavobacterium cryoconiti TaxID=3398736 RepID=UPI003A86F915